MNLYVVELNKLKVDGKKNVHAHLCVDILYLHVECVEDVVGEIWCRGKFAVGENP